MAEGNTSNYYSFPELSERLARELYQAVKDGEADKVSSLLRQRANPNHQLYWSVEWTTGSGWSEKSPPLHRACEDGKLEIVKMLVLSGADVGKGGGRRNSTPLHYSCKGGHKEVVVYLVREAGCEVDIRDKISWTPLHLACMEGHNEIVQYLVEEGKCDVDVRDDWNESPLHLACEYGHQHVVQYLVEKANCDVNVRGLFNRTPLHYACFEGYKEMVQCLVEEGKCDVDVRDVDNKSPLHWACLYGYQHVVQYLVEKANCDINVINDDGVSPLDLALGRVYGDKSCVDVAHYLMSRGCGDEEDKIVLLCGACRWGKLVLVMKLVEQHKVLPNYVRDKNDQTPLHHACEGGELSTVKYLVEKAQCDVNVRDKNGQTPLHKSCIADSQMINLDLIQYLVERGHCDINVTDKNGKTPLDLATEKGNSEVIDYFNSLPPKHCDGQKRVSADNGERGLPPSKRPRSQEVSQPQTLRVCPNCEESCHIRCKSCPQCEHPFPSSSKSRAKPDQEPKKNPANLLQILQKKVDQLAQVGYDVVVLVHTDSSKSHQSSSSSRTRHTYRKYCSPGLAEKFVESPLVYNSWKEHCNTQSTETAEKTTEHAQSSRTAERAPKGRSGNRRQTVGSHSSNRSHDQDSGSHDQVEGSPVVNGAVNGQSHNEQATSTGTLSNRHHSSLGGSALSQSHHLSTILSGPVQTTHNTSLSASSINTSSYQPRPSTTSNPLPHPFLSHSSPFAAHPPLRPGHSYPLNPPLFPPSSPYMSFPFSPQRPLNPYHLAPGPGAAPRPSLSEQAVNIDSTDSEHVNIWS